MARRLLNLLTLLSMLLCAAVVAVWVASYSWGGRTKWLLVQRDGPQEAVWVGAYSAPGLVGYTRVTYTGPGPAGEKEASACHAGWARATRAQQTVGLPSPPGITFWQRRGFKIWRLPMTHRYDPNSMWGSFLRHRPRPPLFFYTDQWFATVPYWFLALAASAVPGARALSLWRRRRRSKGYAAAGLCPRCGYDVRATPGRCPECGTETVAPTSETERQAPKT